MRQQSFGTFLSAPSLGLQALTLCAALSAGCVGTIGDSLSSGPGIPGDPNNPVIPGDPNNPVIPGDPNNPVDPGPANPFVPDSTPPFACAAKDRAVPATVKRLAKIQYVNSMKEFLSTLSAANLTTVLTGLDSSLKQLPEDSVGKDVAVSYAIHDDRLSQDHVDALFGIGVAVGKQLAGNAALVNEMAAVCGKGSTGASLAQAACLDTFVNHYGGKALKRPLSAAELADFKGTYSANGANGLGLMLSRMVLHPRFFYHSYFEGTKVSGTEGVDAVYQLNGDELLAKTAFHFWNRPPDDALYALGAGADLSTDAGLTKVIDYTVASPYAKDALRQFYGEWLQLGSTPSLKGSNSTSLALLAAGEGLDIPTNDHRSAMIEEVLAMTEHYSFAPAGRYDDLMTSRLSFARTADLARLYGTVAWNGNDDALTEFAPGAPRAGLLTRGAFLISGAEYTRPINKGLRVLRRIMCQDVPPPPMDVVNGGFAKITPDPSRTTRQDVDVVLTNPAHSGCMACHESFTPIGYASENYDPLGRFRTEEMKFSVDAATSKSTLASKLAVNTSVDLTIFNTPDPITEPDAIAMSADIAKSGLGQACMVRHYFRFTNGIEEDDAKDGCALAGMYGALAGTDGSLLAMFKQSAKTDSFRFRQAQ